MANAIKQKSGAWRVQAKKLVDGQYKRMSFTVHPKDCGGDSKLAKKKCEQLALEWQMKIEDELSSMTVKRAMEKYIEDRSKVLSPSTLRSYHGYAKDLEMMAEMDVMEVNNARVQRVINDMAISTGSKTIKNKISFLLSVLDYCGNDRKFKLRYPQKTKRQFRTPDTADVQRLLDNADGVMKGIICLAAFGTLRRGEIAGLKFKDISRDMRKVFVHADIVISPEGKWVYKELPKTSGSIRSIQLPAFVFDLLPQEETGNADDFLFKLAPFTISKNFGILRDKCGIDCCLHDLRHYSASFRSDLNIPSKYIEEVGGWTNDSHVLASVYDNKLSSTRKKYIQIANDFIEENYKEIALKKVP